MGVKNGKAIEALAAAVVKGFVQGIEFDTYKKVRPARFDEEELKEIKELAAKTGLSWKSLEPTLTTITKSDGMIVAKAKPDVKLKPLTDLLNEAGLMSQRMKYLKNEVSAYSDCTGSGAGSITASCMMKKDSLWNEYFRLKDKSTPH